MASGFASEGSYDTTKSDAFGKLFDFGLATVATGSVVGVIVLGVIVVVATGAPIASAMSTCRSVASNSAWAVVGVVFVVVIVVASAADRASASRKVIADFGSAVLCIWWRKVALDVLDAIIATPEDEIRRRPAGSALDVGGLFYILRLPVTMRAMTPRDVVVEL
jgi:hypothetical protein